MQTHFVFFILQRRTSIAIHFKSTFMQKNLWQHIEKVRQISPPLVQNITNYVVMNNTANALLAAGASPIMAHAHPEIDEMATICQAIVLNIGTLDEYKVKSMLLAIKKAGELGKLLFWTPP